MFRSAGITLLIGLLVATLDWVLRTFLSQEITSVLLVGALALLSAGRQLDGFANTSDGLIGFRGREWAIATTKFTGDEQGNVTQLHTTRVGPAPKFESRSRS